MKYLDFSALMFVGITLVHDYWLYWGLPQIRYWEIRRSYMSIIDNKDDKNKAA